jgi:hypothetical protein
MLMREPKGWLYWKHREKCGSREKEYWKKAGPYIIGKTVV